MRGEVVITRKSTSSNPLAFAEPRITQLHIGLSVLVIVSVVAAVILLNVPTKYQMATILIIPAAAAVLYILKDPYNGVFLYYAFEFLRPYDFIPALAPLRLTMFIEIVTLTSWLLYLAKTKDSIKWSNFNWLYIGFLGVIAVTVITAANNRHAYNTFQLMAVNFTIFLIATNVVNSKSRLNKLIWLMLITHFYFALRGIYNFAVLRTIVGGQITSGQVGGGYIGDENDFALSLVVMIPFAFFTLTYARKRVKKLVAAIFLLAFVLAVISSFSRGGWIALIAVMLFCIFSSRRKLMTLSYTLLLVIAFALYAPPSYWDEIESIKETGKGTAELRRRYWDAAFRMYLDHPIIGVGAGNSGIWMPNYIKGFAYPESQWGRAIHGTIPQIMAELGSLGTFFFVAMIFYAAKHLHRTRKRLSGAKSDAFSGVTANSILGGIVGYLVAGIFLSVPYYPQLWTLFTLATILFHLSRLERSVSDRTKINTRPFADVDNI